MTIENQDPTGAAGNEGGETSPTTPAPKTEPKVEVKDGIVFVDGKKMVKESDLIAAKQSLESAAGKAQTAHNQAMDNIRLELSAAQQQVADLNAKLQKAQESAPGQGATEEVARIKQERDSALTRVETLTTEAGKALELKKSLLVALYPGVTAEQLANKTMQELDSYEEALKAITTARGGIGPYAKGGGLGQPIPMTDEDRRRKALESTPVLGTRTAQAK